MTRFQFFSILGVLWNISWHTDPNHNWQANAIAIVCFVLALIYAFEPRPQRRL